ncbi:MAG: symmetrical bis(5'-nucleosyl)-tetraphosphatase [Acidobacteriota bacterium]
MATYLIGDVQGCHATLLRLVRRLPAGPGDRLWFVGDLVNRGPQSLDVLRWIRDQGDRAIAVLGNHDLRLLAVADGVRELRARDTFGDVLEAPDRDELLDWLRARPVLHRDEEVTLVHAGLLPAWTLDEAAAAAREAEIALRGEGRAGFLGRLHARPVRPWSRELPRDERLRLGTLALTSLRVVGPDGLPRPEFKGPPEEAPAGCVPWFAFPGRRSRGGTVAFGHWSALGLRNTEELLALDTGCVWGRGLAAVRLEDRVVFHEATAPGDAAVM